MRFDDSTLTAALKNRISAHIDEGRFTHACIISGLNELQLYSLAQNIARALVCVSDREKPCGICTHCKKALKDCHPDIITVQLGKKEKEIRVEQIRDLVRDAAVLPNEANDKIYIIRNADKMNVASQNAFLKLLEEPPVFVTFILLAENPGILLSTVRSRCVRLDIEQDTVNVPETENELSYGYLQALCSDSELNVAQFTLKLEKLDRQEMNAFIENTIALLGSVLRSAVLNGSGEIEKSRVSSAITLLKRLEDMQNYNVSSGHIAGKLAVETAEIILK